ncbi:ShlB/FhaC/HecB family hemolysin secretion/activation protein, partial [Magnetospirillum fulvum]|uniref:ShlB/FhaC/HecB family hemolysin secretion/activation protein n=1 Tax=Magnetospirillum fulvum TaxID=1082 RepID=UPI001B8D6728
MKVLSANGLSSAALALMAIMPVAWAEERVPAAQPQVSESPPSAQRVEILEYRIEGANLLSQSEVEAAVYPFLGPDKNLKDVEDARAALEKAYTAKGFQTVGVEIPPQQVKGGIVTLKVVEGKIGRLRVKGSRYFDLDEIKDAAPSLKEGTVPNFD